MTPYPQPNRQLIEAASWRIACELVRRHPELTVSELHPGICGRDSLALTGPASLGLLPALVLDRSGGLELWRFDSGAHHSDPHLWARYVGTEPRPALVQLERDAGLVAPVSLAASGARTLTYRLLAALAAGAVFGIRPLTILAGRVALGPGDGLRHDLLAALPQTFAAVHRPDGELWFVRRAGRITLALDAGSGSAWLPDGQRHDLELLYNRAGRRLAPLIAHLGQETIG